MSSKVQAPVCVRRRVMNVDNKVVRGSTIIGRRQGQLFVGEHEMEMTPTS